jgi:hypothetical protein
VAGLEKNFIVKHRQPGKMVHIYNPIYLGGREWVNWGLRSVSETISINKLGAVVHICHPRYVGSCRRRVIV